MTTPPDPRAEARALMEWCSTDPMRTENEIALCDALEAMLEREEQKDAVCKQAIEVLRRVHRHSFCDCGGGGVCGEMRAIDALEEAIARREEPKP